MPSPAPPTRPPRRPLHPPTLTRAQRPSSGTATPTTGSATQTLTSTTPRHSESPEPPLVLRLRGAHDSSTQTETSEEDGPRRIRWAEDVIDNEGLGRKSSKVCCIYHRPRGMGESDSESDSSESESDSDSDDRARPVGGKKGRGCGHDHSHGGGQGKRTSKGAGRKPSPNAYERLPRGQREATEKP